VQVEPFELELEVEPELGNFLGEVWTDTANLNLLPSEACAWVTAEATAEYSQVFLTTLSSPLPISTSHHFQWVSRSSILQNQIFLLAGSNDQCIFAVHCSKDMMKA
jgi:hypothetical protein